MIREKEICMKQVYQLLARARLKEDFKYADFYPVENFENYPTEEEIENALMKWNEKEVWNIYYAKVEKHYRFSNDDGVNKSY